MTVLFFLSCCSLCIIIYPALSMVKCVHVECVNVWMCECMDVCVCVCCQAPRGGHGNTILACLVMWLMAAPPVSGHVVETRQSQSQGRDLQFNNGITVWIHIIEQLASRPSLDSDSYRYLTSFIHPYSYVARIQRVI